MIARHALQDAARSPIDVISQNAQFPYEELPIEAMYPVVRSDHFGDKILQDETHLMPLRDELVHGPFPRHSKAMQEFTDEQYDAYASSMNAQSLLSDRVFAGRSYKPEYTTATQGLAHIRELESCAQKLDIPLDSATAFLGLRAALKNDLFQKLTVEATDVNQAVQVAGIPIWIVAGLIRTAGYAAAPFLGVVPDVSNDEPVLHPVIQAQTGELGLLPKSLNDLGTELHLRLIDRD